MGVAWKAYDCSQVMRRVSVFVKEVQDYVGEGRLSAKMTVEIPQYKIIMTTLFIH